MVLIEESDEDVSIWCLCTCSFTYRVKQSSIFVPSRKYPSIARGNVVRLSEPFLVGGLDSKAGETDPSVLAEGLE
jgi:hypothetical protein